MYTEAQNICCAGCKHLKVHYSIVGVEYDRWGCRANHASSLLMGCKYFEEK